MQTRVLTNLITNMKHATAFNLFFEQNPVAKVLAIQTKLNRTVYKIYDIEPTSDLMDELLHNFCEANENIEATLLDMLLEYLKTTLVIEANVTRDSDPAYELYDELSAYILDHIPAAFDDPNFPTINK